MKIALCTLLLARAAVAADPTPAPVPAPAPPPALGQPATAEDAEPATVPVPAAKPNKVTRYKRDLAADIAGNGQAAAGGGKVTIAGPAGLEKSIQILEGDGLLPRTTKTGRTLVIKSTDADAASLANAEEDLSVMALILRKATGASRTEDHRMALGIDVDSSVFGSSSGARNIYLEGYGALFLLGVRYPLIAPTDKGEEKEAKQNVNDNWAEAREEYLSTGGAHVRLQATLDQVWAGNRLPAEPYDPEKVEELKTTLLQALKNASHIRGLKPTDFVTVVIQGADAAHTEKNNARTTGGGRNRLTVRRGETVMTLRVKKPDVDAFAKGTLDLEAFRKRAVIQSYFRRADTSVGTAAFVAPGQ